MHTWATGRLQGDKWTDFCPPTPTLVETCPDKWYSWPKVMRQGFISKGQKFWVRPQRVNWQIFERGCWARVMKLIFAG